MIEISKQRFENLYAKTAAVAKSIEDKNLATLGVDQKGVRTNLDMASRYTRRAADQFDPTSISRSQESLMYAVRAMLGVKSCLVNRTHEMTRSGTVDTQVIVDIVDDLLNTANTLYAEVQDVILKS